MSNQNKTHKPLSIDIAPDTLDGMPLVNIGDTPRPVCPRHLVLMTAYSGSRESNTTYYKCPVATCGNTEKRDRGPNAVIPRRPQICPRCNVACEVDPKFQSRYIWQLICPGGCGFSVRLPKYNDAVTPRSTPTDILDV